jgi:hypothetical protein
LGFEQMRSLQLTNVIYTLAFREGFYAVYLMKEKSDIKRLLVRMRPETKLLGTEDAVEYLKTHRPDLLD